jgi:hypothetical protein
MILKTLIPGSKLILISVLQSIFIPIYSQSLETIDLSKVPPKKVREYIVARSYDHLSDYSSIHASWNRDISKKNFNFIEETFYFKKKLDVVWSAYRHTDPVKMWNCRSFRFGLLICKCSKSIIYPSTLNIPELDTGQVYFLNLRLLKGLVNVPVAFEIINLDVEKRIMEFSYIEGNKERGKQILEFFEDGPGKTRIVHKTYFKSESEIRDDLFYPYFHYRFIEEFHRNMWKLIRKTKSSDEI